MERTADSEHVNCLPYLSVNGNDIVKATARTSGDSPPYRNAKADSILALQECDLIKAFAAHELLILFPGRC
jgi:hypothetical protein